MAVIDARARHACLARLAVTGVMLTALASFGAPPANAATAAASLEKPAQVSALMSRLGITEAIATQDVETQDAVGNLPSAVEEALGNAYAGMWFDPWHARFDIGVAPTTQSSLSKIRSLVAEHRVDGLTDFVPVQSTYGQLLASKTGWDARLGALANRHEAKTMLDASQNAVVLALSADVSAQEVTALATATTEDSVNVRIERIAPAHLGSAVTYLGACTFTPQLADYCDPPLVAGTEIFSPPIGGYFKICTGGFMAQSILPEQYPDHYLLTAGHCFDGGSGYQTGQWASADHQEHAHAIGFLGYRYEDARGDAAFIDLSLEHSYWEDSNSWGWYPYLYTPGKLWGPKSWPEDYSINIVGTNETPNVQYQTPCHSGFGAGVHCGVTEYTEVSERILGEESGQIIGHLVQNSACAEHGDSGGPWFFNNYAMGIMVGGQGGCPSGGPSVFDDLHATDHALGMKVVGSVGTVE
jgi:hypothetical protein